MDNMDLKEELLNKVKAAIEEKLGDGEKCITQQVMKNNGLELTGLSIVRPGGNITPTVYIEGYIERYADGETVENIAREIYKIMDPAKIPAFDLESFMDWNKAKMRVCMRMINRKLNKKLLEKVPHIPFLDLEIVFYYLMPDTLIRKEQVKGSIIIHNSHMDRWGVTEKELYQHAFENTIHIRPPKLDRIEQLLGDLVGMELGVKNESPKLWVLSNEDRSYGAACMLYTRILKDFADEHGKNVYILPSSVHELILLEANDNDDKNALRDMIREVNRTSVSADELLSDNLYYYDRKSCTVQIAA